MTYDGHPSATATGRPCFFSDSASSLELRRSGGLIGSRQSYKQNEINSLEHCHAHGLAPPLLLGFGTLPTGASFSPGNFVHRQLDAFPAHASALRSRLPGIALPFLLATLCLSLTCFLHTCFRTLLTSARNSCCQPGGRSGGAPPGTTGQPGTSEIKVVGPHKLTLVTANHLDF